MKLRLVFQVIPANKWTELVLVLHPFNGLFSRRTWVSQHQKQKTFQILLEQQMMGWHWHMLDHMQIICQYLTIQFLQATCPSCCPSNSVKALKAYGQKKNDKTRMWANAQRDGHPAKYRWRPLQKFCNSIPCTMLQSLADARCWSAVQ